MDMTNQGPKQIRVSHSEVMKQRRKLDARLEAREDARRRRIRPAAKKESK